jgi:TonB family protein
MNSGLGTTTLRRAFVNLTLALAGCFFAAGQSPTPTPTEKPTPEAKASPSPTPQPNNVAASPTGEPSKTTPTQGKESDVKKPPMPARAGMEILSDTGGVDFGPYMKRLYVQVREHWESLVPEVARAPVMKSGAVTIEFAIMKDGSVQGLTLVHSSGEVALDRAAWNGIKDSAPLPRLPAEFNGPFLRLRCNFLYNPAKPPASHEN